MREICTYGSMRGRAYPTRGVPLYSTNRFYDALLDMRKARFIENCSSTHFNRYYLSPLLERGVIARTDPDHPQSPQQRYCLI